MFYRASSPASLEIILYFNYKTRFTPIVYMCVNVKNATLIESIVLRELFKYFWESRTNPMD